MALQFRELTIAPESDLINMRADRGVQQLLGGSRSHITGLFDHDCVTINGQRESNPGRSLREGDQLAVRFEANRRYSPKPKAAKKPHHGFSIIHEDSHLIVVEKSAELLTVPTDAGERNTLQQRINEHVRHEGRGRGAFVVHRLDRGVSGLLVFGKTREDALQIQQQFRQRKPDRQYVAIVAGRIEEAQGSFRTYLSTAKNLNRFSTDDEDDGELAITHFQVTQYSQVTQRSSGVTQVHVQLETGRRNQIRVHFAESGHPILGDMRYRPDLWQHLGWPFKRLALHAATLGFRHPITDESLRFESSMPREMSEFLRFIDNAGDSPGRGSAARSSADRRGQPSAERQERDRRGHTKGRRDQTKRRRRK